MGVVVAAWHIELQQRVAVKVLRAATVSAEDALERFRREARAAAKLRSQHVARVIDVGRIDGKTPFMVMEFLDGTDLAGELAARGTLRVTEAVGHVLQAIEALAEAHAARIVHRDLKPANLFLACQPDGTRLIKVLDFGVSKAVDPTPGSLALTHEHAFIGSPLYTSPEQMRSARDVDARTDIWALGAILFELLSGVPPYMEDSIPGLVQAHMETRPNLAKLRPDAPAELSQIILRCLELDRTNRYQDVGELGLALAAFSPEFALHAQRALRVLGNRKLTESGVEITPARAPSAALSPMRPAEVPRAQRTVTAWVEPEAERSRGPFRRRAGVLGAALLGLALLGLGIARAAKPDAPPATLAAPTLSTVPAPTTLEHEPLQPTHALPVKAPLQAAAPAATAPTKVQTTATTVAGGARPSVVPSTKRVIKRSSPRPQAKSSPSATEKTPSNGLPEFGGRR